MGREHQILARILRHQGIYAQAKDRASTNRIVPDGRPKEGIRKKSVPWPHAAPKLPAPGRLHQALAGQIQEYLYQRIVAGLYYPADGILSRKPRARGPGDVATEKVPLECIELWLVEPTVTSPIHDAGMAFWQRDPRFLCQLPQFSPTRNALEAWRQQ